MENKNIFGMIFLTLIILVFTVGGYFFMNYMTKNVKPEEKNKELIKEIRDLRSDKTKDYIYYENGEEILEEEEITRDEAVLNFTTLTSLNTTLREEEKKIYQNIKYVKDVDLPLTDSEGKEITYKENDEGIYSLQYRNYENLKFGDFVSLVVVDFDYDILNGSVPYAVKSYVININEGKVLSEEELLNKYSLTMDNVKDKIRDRLKDTQVLGEDDNVVIDIEGTISDLKYTLYINKQGKLAASFIVKSPQINYNDVVVLN